MYGEVVVSTTGLVKCSLYSFLLFFCFGTGNFNVKVLLDMFRCREKWISHDLKMNYVYVYEIILLFVSNYFHDYFFYKKIEWIPDEMMSTTYLQNWLMENVCL